MPFYEYECQSCKFYTEQLQKVSDPPLRKCPSCGRNTLKKLVSAPIFRLKGGGWYETDFKSDQEQKRNLAVDKEPESKGTDDSSKTKAADGASAGSKSPDAKSGEGSSGGAKSGEGKSVASPGGSSSGGSSSRGASGRSGGSSASSPRRKVPAKSRPAAKAAAKRRARR